jgi:hypothetical protein
MNARDSVAISSVAYRERKTESGFIMVFR